ncbi:MAG: phage terminase large subunit [Hyphomonadaceae bacterium]|nr:phage terminase large subunit [Hyphomonadaceae bacterium]
MTPKAALKKNPAPEMSGATPAGFNAILRNDLCAFIEKVFATVSNGDTYRPNWHVEAIVHQLMRCDSGEIRRLAILMPPRHLKSIVVSIAYVAWRLGRDPRQRFIVVSHSAELAQLLSRQFRQVVDSDWYRRAFPAMRANPQKNTETEFVTSAGGGRLATSIGGSITGRGGDVIIVDDPMKAELANNESEEARVRHYFDQTLSTRLNNKKTGVMILVMQRLSVGDLAAHVLNDPNWTQLTLSAIAEKDETITLTPSRAHVRYKGQVLHPDHEDEAVFAELRTRLGTAGFAAQYLQAPIPPGAGLLQLDWFQRYNSLPSRRLWELVLHSWDTAASLEEGASYSVWQKWIVIDGKLYLADLIRKRMQYPGLKRVAFELIKPHAPDHVLVERASTGIALGDEFFNHFSIYERQRKVPHIRPVHSKEDRAVAVSALIEAGTVLLPQEAPYLKTLEDEIRSFPNGAHDDQVDAMTQVVWFYDKAYRTPSLRRQ